MSANRTGDLSQLFNGSFKEIRQYKIHPFSPLSTLGLHARTSKQYEAETAFLRLAPAAIHAAPLLFDAKENKENENATANHHLTALASIAILKRHPELLFRKSLVTDHYGRIILASPYQIFLGAGDLWALRQIHEDIHILPHIPNGETQAEADFKEQFPNCPWPPPKDLTEEMLYDDRNKRQIAEIKKQLATVKLLLDTVPFTNNEPPEVTKLAVETLCQLFQSNPGEVIRSGLHFPPAIVKEVYETYNTLQGHWPYFSRAVIKPALDALSTVDGQCCQYGLNDLDMEKGPSRRCHPSYKHSLGKPLSLRFVNDKDNKRGGPVLVDPYDGEVLFESSTMRGWFDCVDTRTGERRAARVGLLRVDWKTYGEQKQKLMGAIMQPFAEKSTHCRAEQKRSRLCVIL